MGNNQPKKYRNFMIGAASAALVATAVAPVASAAQFTDVKEDSTHAPAINALVEAGVINGYTDGTFQPNKTLTRSDVVKMMGKWLVSLGYEVPTDYKTNPRFKDHTSKTNDELLKYAALVKDNGVFNGYPDGTLGAGYDITRENMAIVLVRAYDAIHKTDLVTLVKETEFDKDVTDLAKAKAEARPYIDVLDYFDITNPVAPQFNPKNTTTRGQFASFLYKTSIVDLEAEVDTEAPKLVYDGEKTLNVEYGKEFTTPVVTATDNVDEEIEVTSVITNEAGERLTAIDTKVPGTYKVTYSAVDAAGNNAEELVVTVVVGENPVAEVVSVSAVNAKTIEVKFNKAVDADTLVKDGKDVVTVVAGEGATDFQGVTQVLSEDGKTLTLTATNIFKGDYTVKVPFEIVKDTDGKFVSPINAKVTANDKTAPVLTAATSTIKDTKDGLKKITLSFDEEVVSIDTVKINGMNYSAAVNGKEATVVVDLDATKTYDVTVVNATDAAGNVKDVQVATVNVTVDSVAPSILSVVPAGENKVTVTLDKELANDKLDITGKVGTFSANVVTNAEVNPNNKKEYTVTLNGDYLFKNGNSDTVTLTVAKEALVDVLGNKNSTEVSKNVVVSKDASAPGVVNVATSTTGGKVTSFSITYNEEVQNPNLSKVAVVNSKGEILSINSVVDNAKVSAEDAKTVIFTLADNLATDKYSFDLAEGFVEDKALTSNKSAKYAFNVDVTEAGKPAETSFTINDATVTENVITVDFGAKVKATGTGSALNPSAYQLNGVTLPSNTNIEFAKNEDKSVNQTKVVITLPEGFVKANDDKAVFRVNAVQTLDNKVSNQFTKVLEVSDNTAPEVKSIVATDLKKLTVTYTEAIKLTENTTVADIQDEIKLVDSKGAAIAFTKAEVTEDGKLVLTVEDATKVSSLTTVEVDEASRNILDINNVAQKAGVTVSK